MSTYAVPALFGDAGLDQYVQEINRFPLLTYEEEQMLAIRYREQADNEAAHKLVTSHLRLVAKMARKYRGYGLSMSDLISEGNIGLMKAVQRFNPDKGFRLSTYAIWWIKAALNTFILKSWSLVRVGTWEAQKKIFFSLKKAKKQLRIMDAGSLTDEDTEKLADYLGIRESDLEQQIYRMSARDLSLNSPRETEEGSYELIDLIPDESINIEDKYSEVEEYSFQTDLIKQAMSRLPDRDKIIVSERWLSDEQTTLEELGQRFGITRERVRQLEERAIKNIKSYIAERHPEVSTAHPNLIKKSNTRLSR